jgi:hypothetical protein
MGRSIRGIASSGYSDENWVSSTPNRLHAARAKHSDHGEASVPPWCTESAAFENHVTQRVTGLANAGEVSLAAQP